MLVRQIFTFLLMTAFALQTFNQWIIAAEYRINTAAFAKNCINKAKPILKCKGKCQMMKKMQEEEQKEKDAAQKKGAETNTSISSKSFFCNTTIILPSMMRKYFPQLSYSATSAHLQEIFHPPSC